MWFSVRFVPSKITRNGWQLFVCAVTYSRYMEILYTASPLRHFPHNAWRVTESAFPWGTEALSTPARCQYAKNHTAGLTSASSWQTAPSTKWTIEDANLYFDDRRVIHGALRDSESLPTECPEQLRGCLLRLPVASRRSQAGLAVSLRRFWTTLSKAFTRRGL